jgi:ApaG protein
MNGAKMIYTEITHDIRVIVKPVFIEQESDLISKRFVFTYHVTIENMGLEPVQLMRRQWYITDSNGESHEVNGDGVIGKQPIINPGEAHNYNSFCVLKSFEGSMEGYYEMQKDDGSSLKVTIPRFLLKSHMLN